MNAILTFCIVYNLHRELVSLMIFRKITEI